MDSFSVESLPASFGAQTWVKIVHISTTSCHTFWPPLFFTALSAIFIGACWCSSGSSCVCPTDNTCGDEVCKIEHLPVLFEPIPQPWFFFATWGIAAHIRHSSIGLRWLFWRARCMATVTRSTSLRGYVTASRNVLFRRRRCLKIFYAFQKNFFCQRYFAKNSRSRPSRKIFGLKFWRVWRKLSSFTICTWLLQIWQCYYQARGIYTHMA